MPNEIRITVSASFVNAQTPVTQLELREPFPIVAGELDQVLLVLTRFHQLAEQLRDELAGVGKS